MRANGLFDQKAIRGADANHNYPGLKQVLEKKEVYYFCENYKNKIR
jgi:hypothetical protein